MEKESIQQMLEKLLLEHGIKTGESEVIEEIQESFDLLNQKYNRAIKENAVLSTLLKNTSRDLEEREKKYRELVNNIREIIFSTDKEGNLTFLNPAWEEILGYPVSESLNKSFAFFAPEIHRDIWMRLFFRVLYNPGKEYSFTLQTLNKAGGKVYLEIHASALKDEYGDITSISGTARDVTDKKNALEALRAKRKQLNSLSRATSLLVDAKDFRFTLNECLRILAKGVEADRAYIYENEADETGKQRYSIKYEWVNADIEPHLNQSEYQRRPYDEMPDSIFEKLKAHQPYSNITADAESQERNYFKKQNIQSLLLVPIFVQEKFWGFIGFDTCNSVRSWSEGEASMLQTFSAGISRAIEREDARNELIKARDEAEAASRLKTSFLANISHELRTPMNGILGYASLMRRKIDDDRLRNVAETMYISANRLMETLNLIIDLARIESSKMEVNYEIINLAAIVNEELYKFRQHAKDKGIDLEIEIVEDLIFAEVDQRLFRVILTNIISNAVKFTNKGKVSAKVFSEKQNGLSKGVVQITDTGIGIDADKQALIFEGFRQESEGINRNFEGLGLGLTIARKLVDLMDGELIVSSKKGEGSCFTVKFAKQLRRQEVDSKTSAADENLPHVLLVEDDAITREIVGDTLKLICNVDFAFNGMAALEMAEKKQYKTILMDIHLGRHMSGLDVTRTIRKMKGYKSVPIIALTAFSSESDKKEIFQSGCTHYLAKPFELEVLESYVNKVLNGID